MNHEQMIEDGARATYIAYHRDEPSFKASAAWDDMGGSEPSFEVFYWQHVSRAAWAAFHPTITTRAEFDALPYGSIVMDEIGCAMRKTLAGWLVDSADLNLSTSDLIATSTIATVLHYGSDTP